MNKMSQADRTGEKQPQADTIMTDNVTGTSDTSDFPHESLEFEAGSPVLYRIVLGLLTVVALFLAVYSWNLGIGSFSRPAPGLWIFVVSVMILVSIPGSIVVKEKFEVFKITDVSRSVIMAAGLGAFVLLYPWFGFLIAGGVSLVIITRYSALETWRNTWIIAIGTPAVLYVLFGVLFQVSFVPLPTFF